MALTIDRNYEGTVYTAAVLNTYWAALVSAVSSQLLRSNYSAVNGWSISESDPEASSINRPDDLTLWMIARLYAAGLATGMRVPHPDGGGKCRIILWEYGRSFYGSSERRQGLTFPILGWFDVTPGAPYSISTSGEWVGVVNFGDSGDIMGFSADIELMIDRLNERAPVVVVTTSLAAYTATGSGVGKYITANANGSINTVDGVTLAVGDRVLYAPTTAHADAGIYVVTTVGDGSTPWRLTRSGDCDASQAVHTSVRVRVNSGTVYAGKWFRIATTGTISLESTAVLWSEEVIGIGSSTRAITGAGALTAADNRKILMVTMGTYQIDLPAASGNANLMFCLHFGAGAGTITIDANASETIDGAATKSNTQNENRWIWCDGSNWHTVNNA